MYGQVYWSTYITEFIVWTKIPEANVVIVVVATSVPNIGVIVV